jgi:hypothetical protein
MSELRKLTCHFLRDDVDSGLAEVNRGKVVRILAESPETAESGDITAQTAAGTQSTTETP